METIFNINREDIVFTYSDIGWIVGHNYIVYAPLIRGATTIMYEGKPVGTPNPGTLWRMVEDYKVSSFFIAPTAVRAIKKEDINGDYIKKHDTSTIKGIHIAGERCDPKTFNWV